MVVATDRLQGQVFEQIPKRDVTGIANARAREVGHVELARFEREVQLDFGAKRAEQFGEVFVREADRAPGLPHRCFGGEQDRENPTAGRRGGAGDRGQLLGAIGSQPKQWVLAFDRGEIRVRARRGDAADRVQRCRSQP